ncbi:MAG: aminotransferase class I/II-fold pyridoxal phosphate-dependent enzyme [Deltaproteobacteria bacterium]|nr:aminotransferase class I/II-fold pyridoxal phosphate-dependent enzyme [Deltaproteobacteria bacterium]
MKKREPPYVVRPPTAVLTRGFDPRLSVGSARPAVFRSSTYVFTSPDSAARAFEVALGRARPAPGENVDLIYARLSHPNAEILEDQVVPLEREAQAAAVFNSGMAAISTTFLTFCGPGQTVIYTTPVYGGTRHFLRALMEPWGLRTIAVPAGDTLALERAVESAKDLRIVLVETPANPTLVMTDLRAAVEAARRRPDSPLVVVDNTFLGPTFQHPLELGADLVVYSATKYLAGFSDVLAGVVLARDPELVTSLRGTRAVLGNILQPDESWLLQSRLPTVTLRMNRQSKNAQRIAELITKHPAVTRVLYPSLFTDHEQARIRDAQCDFPGAMMSIELAGGRPAAFTFLRSLRIVRNAVSLGGMESLACHPRTTTHSELPVEELDRAGIGEGLVRISVGTEDWRDLLRDIRDALDAA